MPDRSREGPFFGDDLEGDGASDNTGLATFNGDGFFKALGLTELLADAIEELLLLLDELEEDDLSLIICIKVCCLSTMKSNFLFNVVSCVSSCVCYVRSSCSASPICLW
jgi:hypothetical protein